jgi:hypothetical protein
MKLTVTAQADPSVAKNVMSNALKMKFREKMGFRPGFNDVLEEI